jgi:ribonuclease HI
MKGRLHTDGGARGNPGPAGIGAILFDADGNVIGELAEGIGAATNNVAEYTALLEGLDLALRKGVTDVDVYLDSQLVVSQVKGEWKIKNERLRALAAKAQSLLSKFDTAALHHVPREKNADADKLANQGMDKAELDLEDEPEQGSFL